MLCRSITLVGEKERKNLKLACKTSTVPVKHRIVSPGTQYLFFIQPIFPYLLCCTATFMNSPFIFSIIDVIDMFKRKIKDLEKDIADILKEEEEDKQVKLSSSFALSYLQIEKIAIDFFLAFGKFFLSAQIVKLLCFPFCRSLHENIFYFYFDLQ